MVSGAGIPQRLTVVFSRDLLPLPMRAEGVGIVHLQAVHSYVAFAGLWVARDYAGESDEAARILGPALQDREVEQGKVIALDYFFAGAGGDSFREKLAGLGEEREAFLVCRGNLVGI